MQRSDEPVAAAPELGSPIHPVGSDRQDRYLSDLQVVAAAALAWLGATVARPVPGGMMAGALLLALGLGGRRPALVLAAVVVLASARGASADLAFVPVDAAPVATTVSLVGDPAPAGAGWHCDLRLRDGRRVEGWAYGRAGFALSGLTAGDRVTVEGRLQPLADQPWSRARHLLGRLAIDELGPRQAPGGPRAWIEWVRGRVSAGGDTLPERLRPLYLGLVIGDDRLQPPDQQARFRAAGMSHLLAVSGQNVAFLLAVVRPVVQLAGRRARFGLTLAVLVAFAVATRAEPSVLRATVTAGLASLAALEGHRQGGQRLLALAVTGLVLTDPFLINAVGFQLSVAASAGILVLSPWIASRLPGPAMVADALAVTLGAQIAVYPLLLHRFGPVSMASVPANLAAGWAAGAVMTWGLSVGVAAGFLPSTAAAVVQAPAALLVRWLDAVASWAPRLPLPLMDARLAAVMVIVMAVWWLYPARALRLVSALSLVIAGGLAVPQPPHSTTPLDGGGRWIPAADGRPSVVVIDPGADTQLLDAVLAGRITAIDVVVATRGGSQAARLVTALRGVTTVGAVLAPPQHRIRGARTVHGPLTIVTGDGPLEIAPADVGLDAALPAPDR